MFGRSLTILSIFILLFHATPAFAQSQDEEIMDAEGQPVNGTLSDEDIDNEDLVRDRELFGTEEAGEDEGFVDEVAADEDGNTLPRRSRGRPTSEVEIAKGLDEDYVDSPTHMLTFNYDTQLTVSDQLTGTPFLEISYNTHIEQEIQVSSARFRTTSKAIFTTDVVGNLAGNELFTCKLEINIEEVPVNLLVRHNFVEETENDAAKSELALQIKFNKKFKEDWKSNCNATDGSIFNTTGDPEQYLYKALESADPNLQGLVIPDYLSDDAADLEIITQPTDILDEELREVYTISGSGTVTVEPLQ